MCGVATGLVVLKTAVHAIDQDLEVTVLSDLCVDADQARHDACMDAVFPTLALMCYKDAISKKIGDMSCKSVETWLAKQGCCAGSLVAVSAVASDNKKAAGSGNYLQVVEVFFLSLPPHYTAVVCNKTPPLLR